MLRPLTVSQEKAEHARRDRSRREDAKNAEPLKFATSLDVTNYLRETKREHLCEPDGRCLWNKIEPALVPEMMIQRHRAEGPESMEDVNKLRGFLRALNGAERERPLSGEEALERATKSGEIDAILERKIRTVLERQEVGEKIEPVVEALEDIYARLLEHWKTNEAPQNKAHHRARLEELRPLRNILYSYRAHPKFAARMHPTNH